jgi:hypothetical protein
MWQPLQSVNRFAPHATQHNFLVSHSPTVECIAYCAPDSREWRLRNGPMPDSREWRLRNGPMNVWVFGIPTRKVQRA